MLISIQSGSKLFTYTIRDKDHHSDWHSRFSVHVAKSIFPNDAAKTKVSRTVKKKKNSGMLNVNVVCVCVLCQSFHVRQADLLWTKWLSAAKVCLRIEVSSALELHWNATQTHKNTRTHCAHPSLRTTTTKKNSRVNRTLLLSIEWERACASSQIEQKRIIASVCWPK